ncbi:putative ribonuclease H-like domain-containing protein [Tanacetum coccineum]
MNNVNSTNNVNVASTNKVNAVGGKTSIKLPDDLNMPALEDIVYSDDDEDDGVEADMNNSDTTIQVSPYYNYKNFMIDLPLNQVIGELEFCSTTNKKNDKEFEEHEEPKKVIHALKDPSCIDVMQEELLQFKLQEVWTLVELPNGKQAIGTKWVFRNKKDERGIMIKNKARLVAQGWMVKIAYHYGKIEEEVYVCQPPGFEDLDFPDRVYKVEKALYRLHQAPRAWYETLSTYLLDNGFQGGKIDKTLFIRRDKGDILLVQVYVDDIIFVQQRRVCACFGEVRCKEKFQEVLWENYSQTARHTHGNSKPLLKDEMCGAYFSTRSMYLFLSSLAFFSNSAEFVTLSFRAIVQRIDVIVVGAGVGVGVDCCGRGVIGGIIGGMVGAAAVEVFGITVTGMVRKDGV